MLAVPIAFLAPALHAPLFHRRAVADRLHGIGVGQRRRTFDEKPSKSGRIVVVSCVLELAYRRLFLRHFPPPIRATARAAKSSHDAKTVFVVSLSPLLRPVIDAHGFPE